MNNKALDYYYYITVIFIAFILSASGCSSGKTIENADRPPLAEKKVQVFSQHHISRKDFFHWLSDTSNRDVVNQMKEENRYTIDKLLASEHSENEKNTETRSLSGIENTDVVPFQNLGWDYRFESGNELFHSILFRYKEKQKEEIFDANKIRTLNGRALSLLSCEPSPDGKYLTLGVEVIASARQILFLIDLNRKEKRIVEISNACGLAFWSLDSKSIYYVESDPVSKLQELTRNVVGNESQVKKVLYQEKNQNRRLRLSRSASGQYLLLDSFDRTSNELSLISLRMNLDRIDTVIPRQSNLSCSIDHQDNLFFLISNHENPNRGVYVSNNPEKDMKLWNTILAPQEGFQIVSAVYPLEHLVVKEIDAVSVRIRAINRYNQEPMVIATISKDKECSLFYKPALPSCFFYSVQSPVQPIQKHRYDLLLQVDHEEKSSNPLSVSMGDTEKYQARILQATANDGFHLPIVMYFKTDLIPNSQNPAIILVQSQPQEPNPFLYNAFFKKLIGKGILLAVLQSRRILQPVNIADKNISLSHRNDDIYDLISCADFLVNQHWTHPDRMAVIGHEESCWTIGSVLNLKPSLFSCAIQHSPIMDPLALLMDNQDPLHLMRLQKWGDPNDKVEFDVLFQFSPYDQLEPKDYPPVLSISDQMHERVPCWQALKWGNKMRLLNTSVSPVFIFTNLGNGPDNLTSEQIESMQENFLYRYLGLSPE